LTVTTTRSPGLALNVNLPLSSVRMTGIVLLGTRSPPVPTDALASGLPSDP
jgi:hypothetical protein